MGLQASYSFEKYFRAFQNNSAKGQRYQLALLSSVLCGIPNATVDSDQSGSFTVLLDSGEVRDIPWSRLLSASQI